LTTAEQASLSSQRLPKGWTLKRFEELLAEPVRNGIYKKKEFHGRGQKIINMGELFAHDFISNQEMKRVELNSKELAKSLVQDGDLLFARRSLVLEGSGKCSLVVRPSEDTTFESSIIRARLNRNEADPKFYFYLWRSPPGRALMASIATRTAVSGITGSNLIQLKVPHPPLSTQRKIAAVLSAYDELIENNTRRIEILEEMARAIYREWFVNFRFPGHEKVRMVDSPLGPIPEGWEIARLGDVCTIVMGQSPKSEFYNDIGEGLPFHQGVTDFGRRFPTDRMYCTVENRIAEAGDILFSVRAPVGRINLAIKRMVIGRGLAAIRSTTSHQAFIFQQLKERFQEEDSIGGGTIFKAVTKSDMHGLKVLRPEKTLVQQFESIMQPMFAQLENLTAKNDNLRRTRNLLLPRLISGEVSVEGLEIRAEAPGP